MPRSAASETARLDGAPTATSTGQPATAAFCTSSNERRPLTQSTDSRERQAAVEERPADHLVERVVPADVLARAEQLAGRGEEAGRVQAAGRGERRLRLAQPVGQRRHERERDAAASTRRAAPRPRPPRARLCRRRRTTTSCRSSAGAAQGRSPAPRPRPCSRRGRPAVALPVGSRPSERQKPSASSSSCPGVRIVTATGRPPMRISSGSSTATWSRSLRPAGRRTTSTAAAEYGGASMDGNLLSGRRPESRLGSLA